MKSSLLLSAALALLLPVAPVSSALAYQDGGVEARHANTRGAKKAADAKANAASNQAPEYPNATRESPKQAGSKELATQMEALFKLQEQENSGDAIIAKADAILADSRANAFDKSSAAYLAGGAWQGKENGPFPNAVKYYQQAIDANGLHNNNHYRAMLQLAQLLEAGDRHDDALKMLDRFQAETKTEDSNSQSIRSQILLGMNKPKEAAASLEKLLASKPGDKRIMMNLASLYMQSNEDAKAAAMFDKMRAAGLLTETRDYETGYRLLANIAGREKDALALIDEGLAKGILTPSYDIYAFQGQVYYGQERTDKAIEAWTKGAPLSKDGEMYLNLGKLQAVQQHWANAKASAKSALGKGVKRQGDAWQVIGQSELESGNKAGALAAYREAAKYPETKKWAAASIKAAGAK